MQETWVDHGGNAGAIPRPPRGGGVEETVEVGPLTVVEAECRGEESGCLRSSPRVDAPLEVADPPDAEARTLRQLLLG
jgi:hypothetical protein